MDLRTSYPNAILYATGHHSMDVIDRHATDPNGMNPQLLFCMLRIHMLLTYMLQIHILLTYMLVTSDVEIGG